MVAGESSPLLVFQEMDQAAFDQVLETVARQDPATPIAAADLPAPQKEAVMFLASVGAVNRQYGRSLSGLGHALARRLLSADNGGEVGDRLESLLKTRYIRLRIKVRVLAVEPPPRLENVRCISDVRFAFTRDADDVGAVTPDEPDEIFGALRMHRLVLTTDSQDDDDKVISVTVSEHMINEMVTILQRVLDKKVPQLIGIIEKTGQPDLTNDAT